MSLVVSVWITNLTDCVRIFKMELYRTISGATPGTQTETRGTPMDPGWIQVLFFFLSCFLGSGFPSVLLPWYLLPLIQPSPCSCKFGLLEVLPASQCGLGAPQGYMHLDSVSLESPHKD